MKIEAGKYYKTRDGRKVGPVEATGYNECYPKTKFWVEDYGLIQENGKFGNDEDSPSLDLISEWLPWETIDYKSPIRTVTRREIVAGQYGLIEVVDVDENGASLWMPRNGRFPAETLREMAHILNQIAEVLEENGK